MSIDHSPTSVAELLELALDDPSTALERGRALLADAPEPWWESVARHARGLALRELGEGEAAVSELRRAVQTAERSGDPDRAADVRATLGATLVTRGRTRAGLDLLARAADSATDPRLRATVLMRRGVSLSWLLGRHHEALADLRQALDGFLAADDPTWEARTRNWLGLLHLAVGDVAAADEQERRARELLLELGHEVEATQALHNLGLVAYARGDLPTALATYDQVAAELEGSGVDAAPLVIDRAQALLAAGLPDEAVRVVTEQLARPGGLPVQRAELDLWLAMARMALGETVPARVHAETALTAFRRAERDWFAAQAELVALRARAAGAGRLDRRVVPRAVRVAEALEGQRSEQAVTAWLLAGRLAARFDPSQAPPLLERAARHRSGPTALTRASGWLARGQQQALAGNRRGVHDACRRGLDALDAHRATLGSTELRALATAHGTALADLALSHAVDAPPRTLLWWSERWRATALAQPPVRPAADDPVAAPLAALRDNARRLLAARADGEDTTRLRAERSRLESEVRAGLRRRAGDGTTADLRLDVSALVEAVGDDAFVELVEVDGSLHAVLVRGGRTTARRVGLAGDAQQAIDFSRWALRRAARGRPDAVPEAAERLQGALLGDLALRIRGARRVVVSPPSRLHGAPWSLVPALTDVAHSVVPSASLWLRARERAPAAGPTVFVCGPGLTTGGAEVDVVAPRHPDALVLRHGDATVERSLAALDGAGLAHVAAHGHFRADSPLFSSLDLDDGPLTVHDFERMARPPHRVVLSACESGVMAAVGAGELLGLVSALLGVGTAGVVASVVVVNDEATAEVMVDLHARLADGDDLADAMLSARRAAAGDALREATAGSFAALGV
ncbi:CHAT domain-containing protein [Nocardioides taihuensis]|uniref:CHAT domain-containing protein n=1 Tax=Nocardioides taihuensis TaxID=1835606 RepID=A0ABW0BQT4_9ACTN